MAGTRTTRAVVLERPNVPVRVEELRLEGPLAGEVLVRMLASGVCHSDLHHANGDWGDPGPLVLGHEGAGVVEEVGPRVDGLRAGQLVALSWYYPCGKCGACAEDAPWRCTGTRSLQHRLPDGRTPLRRPEGTEILPLLAIGTFAEFAVVPAQAAISMPPGTPVEVAALIGCGVTTGVMAALRTAQVRPGSSVVVIGLGGVGLSAVMGAAVAGAGAIVAVDRVDEKLARAREFGATDVVASTDDREATLAAIREAAGGGAHFAFEAIGLPATLELAIDALRHGGTAVAVGIPPFGARASFDVGVLVDRSATIVGSNYGWSNPALDFPRLAELYLEGKLPIDRLIEERIGLDGVGDALDALARGEGLRRVVVFEDHP
ncbi:MAG TPA: zinc-binding dehydrogenase [Actinomycetota bacterium]|jgi:S-(hydroxymethyl)glutathione dehydrogenase/alcohol dehydrogenase